MAPPRKRTGPAPGRLRPMLVVGLLLAALGLAGGGLRDALAHRVPLGVLFGTSSRLVTAALGLSTLLAAIALVSRARALVSGRAESRSWPPLRVAAYVLVAGDAVVVLALQPYRSIVVSQTFGVCGGVYAALVLWGGALAERVPRGARLLADIVMFHVVLLAVGGELALQAWASTSRSPLFARETESVVAFIERYRLQPGQASPGFPVNATGHFDEDFVPGGAPFAITIGDSFSTSIVPHAWHFTTVAERVLGGSKVHNMGVAAIGPREYLHLLRDEALPLQPRIVVVDLFIGNDLTAPMGESSEPGVLRRWLEAEQLLVWLVPRRLLALSEETADDARGAGSHPVVGGAGGSREELIRKFPWLVDPFQEVPVFTPDGFLRTELRRARGVCRAGAPPDWERLFALLSEMRAACGERTFAVMLIPDEFQVEDAVWDEVVARASPETLERELPQSVLGRWLSEQGIPYLDLLPVLRAVPPLQDGRRHVYHQRETHWNARGNEAAGEALAGFLAELASADPR